MNVFWGVLRSFLFEECPRSRSRLAVMRGLANALTLPPIGRGGEPPWTKEMGCPSFTPSGVWLQTYKSFADPVLDSCTTQSVKQLYFEAIAEIGTVYAFTSCKMKNK